MSQLSNSVISAAAAECNRPQKAELVGSINCSGRTSVRPPLVQGVNVGPAGVPFPGKIAASLDRTARRDIHAEISGREADVFAALGISWPQSGMLHIRCPIPGHEDRKPSWRYDAGECRYHCTCGGGTIADLVMKVKGLDFAGAASWIRQEVLGCSKSTSRARGNGKLNGLNGNQADPQPKEDPGQREYAFRIFGEAGPLKGTIGERYFRETRGIDPSQAMEAMRFHPGVWCKEQKRTLPAIVNAFRTCPGGEPFGAHITYIGPRGEKPDLQTRKRTFGKWKGTGAAIYLMPPGPRTLVLEGVEKAIFCANAASLPAIAAGSNSAMKGMSLAPGIEELIIGADRGKGGEDAAQQLARRAHEASVKVRICFPPSEGRDWDECDPEAVRAVIEAAPLWEPAPESERSSGEGETLSEEEQGVMAQSW